MNPQELQRLREERAELHSKAMKAKGAMETAHKSEDADSKTKFDQYRTEFNNLVADCKRVDSIINADEVATELDAMLADPEEGQISSTEAAQNQLHSQSFMAFANGGMEAVRSEFGDEGLKILRRGPAGSDTSESDASGDTRHQAVTVSTGNTVLIPKETQRRVEKTLKAFGGLAVGVRVIRTTHGREYVLPVFDRIARNRGSEHKAIAEAETVGDATDITTTEVSFKAYKKSSGILKVGTEVRFDSIVDFEQMCAEELGEDLARQLAHSYANANGKKNAAANAGTDALGLIHSVLASSKTANRYVSRIDTGDARAWYLNWRDIYGLKHAIDPGYAQSPNARYFFGATAWEKIAFLQDDNGRPLWITDVRSGEPTRYAGRPYSVGYDVAFGFPASAAADPTFMVGYGDMRKFAIRYAGGLRFRVTDERYWEDDERGYNFLQRVDHKVIDANAFATLIASGDADVVDGAPHKSGSNPRPSDALTKNGVLLGTADYS